MKRWSPWESARHQVAIGGCVVDAEDRPIAGAAVTLIRMPEEFKRKVASGTSAQVLASVDGAYYFLDLPNGQYTVKGRDERSGSEMEKAVSVSRNKDGKVMMAVADFKLVGGGAKEPHSAGKHPSAARVRDH